MNGLKIIPLGGLSEIAKNMTVFEYGNDIVVLDAGLAFPDDDLLGVDMVIQDITYLKKNRNKIRGVVLTHGHEDHIGGLPYLLKEINVPVYGTELTLGILKYKLKEHKILGCTKLNVINPGETFKLGPFKIEFIRSNHSIAGSVMVAFHTPVGVILHTGDFKLDCTPIDGGMVDLARVGELGKKGILALMSDSTNAEREGYTMSERVVGGKFQKIFENHENERILVATFASNVHRVQQIIDVAYKFGRKVAISGRSMQNVIAAAMELGYMKIPESTLINIDDISHYPRNKLVIVTTGTQGEPMSGLTRMAASDHKKVTIENGDLVIISANPIPGNERAVGNVINELFRRGAYVIYESVHVSGHACQEELKIILNLAHPKYFIPVHGEYRHLFKHKELAKSVGYDSKDIFILDNGNVLTLNKNEAKVTGNVPAGRVFVDGSGVGDVGNIVLRDRKHLAQDGLIIVVVGLDRASGNVVSGPDIVSRGFIYVRESEDLIEKVKQVARGAIDDCEEKHTTDWPTLKQAMKNALNDYLYSKTKRRPMILPIIMEI